MENLLLSGEELARRGIEVVRTGRGGDVTYHGPGQLIGYPIVDLDVVGRDLHRYLRQLEDVLIAVLATYGVRGERVTGKTGAWVEGEKIASIGVGVRRWVSWHGFALNLDDDLDGFSAIVPCGLPGVRMTSLERLLDRPVSRCEAEERIIHAFATIFDCDYAGNQTTCR
jgi:lipoate-protein ligase B